jgi:hypothetical protein
MAYIFYINEVTHSSVVEATLTKQRHGLPAARHGCPALRLAVHSRHGWGPDTDRSVARQTNGVGRTLW